MRKAIARRRFISSGKGTAAVDRELFLSRVDDELLRGLGLSCGISESLAELGCRFALDPDRPVTPARQAYQQVNSRSGPRPVTECIGLRGSGGDQLLHDEALPARASDRMRNDVVEHPKA